MGGDPGLFPPSANKAEKARCVAVSLEEEVSAFAADPTRQVTVQCESAEHMTRTQRGLVLIERAPLYTPENL